MRALARRIEHQGISWAGTYGSGKGGDTLRSGPEGGDTTSGTRFAAAAVILLDLIMIAQVLLVVALLPASAVASAVQVFQCTDRNQKITFQDFPCKDAADSRIVTVDPTPPLRGTKSLTQTQRELDALNQRVTARVNAENIQTAQTANARTAVLDQCDALGSQIDSARRVLSVSNGPDRDRTVAGMLANRKQMEELRCPTFGRF